MSTKWRWLASH